MRDEYDFTDKNPKRGAVIPSPGKARITIMRDEDESAASRELAEAEGRGYQTAINATPRAALAKDEAPLTGHRLREALREELRRA